MRKLIVALIALFFVTSAPALAQAAWRISEASGQVSIIENGRTRPAARGAVLPGGSVVATGPRARAVLIRNRDYVIVSPSSRMRVPTDQQRGPRGLVQMVNESGTAMFRIERRATPHFAVQTPYLAAVVKGTVFTVTVDATGASVQVTEGAVEVSTADGGAAELVRPGMIGMVSAADLQLLNIQGESNRSIRSNGAPAAEAVIVPPAEVGSYRGPAEGRATIDAPVAEDPVGLADATDGLVSGDPAIDLAMVDLRDAARPVPGPAGSGTSDDGAAVPAPAAEDGNNGHGNDDGGTDAGNPGNGGGNENSGPGNNNGGGNDGATGGDDDSGPGNGNGGGNENSGPGNNNGGGNDDATNVDDGNNGHGNDDDGADAGNPGNGGGNDNSGPGNNNGGGNDNSGPGNGGGNGGDDDDD